MSNTSIGGIPNAFVTRGPDSTLDGARMRFQEDERLIVTDESFFAVAAKSTRLRV